ncbi:alanine racemase [Mesotoga sp. SC_NapDC2]|nr:alanine racemase [Mesotoga sp. SC_NapDC3]PXF35457.1 alanine racemase [Mesotoga sp. SC_NapDC]RAM63341.1 alanine racemase [Mesotoga sp. SC_3PWM13N19]RIZ61663.1 alanine racemase [Mesotoga sp. SC_NapDC2]
MNSRKTYALVNLSAYRQNLLYLAGKAYPARLMAVVKADAYGHGAEQLSKVAEEAGVERLAVAFLEEGIKLRESGISLPILVLNYVDNEEILAAKEYGLTLSLCSSGQLDSISGLNETLPDFEIAVDTGMRRLGMKWEESIKLYKSAVANGIKITGAYTHFATADEKDSDFVFEQSEEFRKFLQGIGKSRGRDFVVHISNSAGTIFLDNKDYDYVRVGIATYGLQPSSVIDYNLKPIIEWKTCISFLKKIRAGDSVSYGRTFVAGREMLVATIPVGYADGFNRLLSNRGCVIIAGRRCRVLGRVCMDQFVVDVSHVDSKLSVGDEVVIIGSQKEETITAEEIAELCGTINYEVVCSITSRVPRIYWKGEDYETPRHNRK